MKHITVILSLLLISAFSKAQDLNALISLLEKKEYKTAIEGLNNFLNQTTATSADLNKARYYLGKAIFDMLSSGTKTAETSYSDALNHWKWVLKNDKNKTWLSKIETDILRLIELSCTGADKKIDFQKEITIYKELLDITPDNPVLLFGMGEAYDHGNQHLSAFNQYTKTISNVMQRQDNQYKEISALANLRIAEHKLYKSNNYTEALSYARYGLTLAPDNLELKITEALALYKSGDKENGLKKFEAILSRFPDNAYVREKYAFLLEHTNPEKAAEHYESLLKNRPDYQRALLFLGEYYTGKATEIFNNNGNMQEVQRLMLKGIEHLEKYRSLNPQDKETIHTLIRFYDNLRMTDKADALRKEAEKY
jgi:tetratricopeptide (TPR) repeat protein